MVVSLRKKKGKAYILQKVYNDAKNIKVNIVSLHITVIDHQIFT